MKMKCAVWIIGMVLFLNLNLSAQRAKEAPAEPAKLGIAYNKTTSLVFPYAIKSIDRGSRDILVQKVADVENVLQVKAAVKGFEETNLTVVCADGSLYSYIVRYADQPSQLNVSVGGTGNAAKPTAIFSTNATNDVIAGNAELVAHKRRSIWGLNDQQFGVVMDIKGIYIEGDHLYFQVLLQNNTNIGYDISQLRMFIKDKEKIKRTASQEIEVNSVHVNGDTERIPAMSEQVVALVVKKFTIPDKKYLELQLFEANGGRHQKIRLRNKSLLSATPLL